MDAFRNDAEAICWEYLQHLWEIITCISPGMKKQLINRLVKFKKNWGIKIWALQDFCLGVYERIILSFTMIMVYPQGANKKDQQSYRQSYKTKEKQKMLQSTVQWKFIISFLSLHFCPLIRLALQHFCVPGSFQCANFVFQESHSLVRTVINLAFPNNKAFIKGKKDVQAAEMFGDSIPDIWKKTFVWYQIKLIVITLRLFSAT